MNQWTYRPFTDPALFYREVWDFLYQEEGINTVALGVIQQLLETPPRYEKYFLAGLYGDGALQGTALMTPPHPFNLYLVDAAGLPAALDFAATIEPPYSVLGAGGIADSFAKAWCQKADATIKDIERQGIYELNQVVAPLSLGGHLRLATDADTRVATDFFYGFCRDVSMPVTQDEAREMADRQIHRQTLFLWQSPEQQHPVGCAAVTRETATGACVSYVYTPQNWRGKGVASNVVAKVCEQLLAGGKKRIFLYTQMHNPTSNKIYQAIGFRKIADSARLRFRYQRFQSDVR